MKTGAVIIRLVAVVFLGLVGSSFAANHYICPGAAGSANGTEWTDAYTGIGTAQGNINPASMVRGDTYYVANGQITPAASQTTFGAAESGTNVITIQKAVDGANGTNTGWTNGGTGACNSSQAAFGPMWITTSYWTFNGVTRSTSTGEPWVDWRNHSSYGFYINNNNGSNQAVIGGGGAAGGGGAVVGGNQSTNTPVKNITMQYFEINGSHNGGGGCDLNASGGQFDSGVYFSGGQSGGDYFGFYYIHDVGIGATILVDGLGTGIGSGTTIEYGWNQNTCYTHANHSEMFNFRAWNNSTANGLIARYNFLENAMGTAYIATPCGCSDIQPANWEIYGNVLFYNASESYAGAAGAGDGWLSIWNFSNFGGYLKVYNNTIASIDQPGGACHHDWGGFSGATMGTVDFKNNTYYNCVENIAPASCPGTCSSYSDTYNSYFDMNETNDPDKNAQISQTAPFGNVGQSAGQDNFTLLANTTMWYSLASPYNVDMAGTTRTSSRGAYQFGSSATPPNPPTGLTAAVQ